MARKKDYTLPKGFIKQRVDELSPGDVALFVGDNYRMHAYIISVCNTNTRTNLYTHVCSFNSDNKLSRHSFENWSFFRNDPCLKLTQCEIMI
jgi:hypothetical protein